MEANWKGRLPVWACDHLWERAENGEREARDAIACAAASLALDSGENVALCDACAARPRHVFMSQRWTNVAWLEDRNTQTPFDLSDTEDGSAQLDYPHFPEEPVTGS